jgi:hypothetical protein
MAIQLMCPHCHKRLTIKRPQPGTTLYCPVCTGRLIGPPAKSENSAPAQDKPWWLESEKKTDSEPESEIGKPLRAVEPKWYSQLNGRLIAGAGVAAASLAIALTVGAAWLSKPAPQVTVVVAPPEPERRLIEIDTREPESTSTLPLEVASLAGPLVNDVEWVEEVGAMASDPTMDRPATDFKPAKEEPKIYIKRRDRSTDEELRKQLVKAPELSLDPPGGFKRSYAIATRGPTLQSAHFSTPSLMNSWADLRGLPFRTGVECQLGKEPAETMQALSRKMRTSIAAAQGKDRFDSRIQADALKEKFAAEEMRADLKSPASIPCMMQMLTPENTPVRQLMIEQVSKIESPRATDALVKMALFDLSADVRTDAIRALANRQPSEYRLALLEGFRYPWAPVADHAAEALVALKDRDSASALRLLANEPDPSAPRYDASQKTFVVPELARINHLSNCMMCHASSRSANDMVRGKVPVANQPLPPLTQYYEDTNGTFVRADVTYLRQDFSVPQPVDNPGQWPSMQRYDYLVRMRPMSYQETQALQIQRAAVSTNYPQREAVLFALRELER